MANTNNLMRGNPEQQFKKNDRKASECGKKGGVASGEAKRRRKSMREAFEEILNMRIVNQSGEESTGLEELVMAQYNKALTGDTKAFETIRDLVGEKPVEKIIMSNITPEITAEVESLVKEIESETGN